MKMMTVTCKAGHTFEIPSRRGRPPMWCDEHRPAESDPKPRTKEPKPKTRVTPSAGKTITQALTIQTLTCANCGNEWERKRTRGKVPSLCPTCKEDKSARERNYSKSRNVRPQTRDEAWNYIQSLIEPYHCHCELDREQTYAELVLYKGCKHPHYVCPVLDRWTQKVHQWDKKSPFMRERDALDILEDQPRIATEE